MDDPQNLDELKELLCFNIYSLNRSFGRFYQAAFSQTGLTYSKFVILMALDADGPMSISALSKRASVEPHTLSPIVKKMAEFGAITRQRADDDERRVELAITAKGREVLERARAVVGAGFDELGIDADQMLQAMQFLATTRERVEKADPPKLSFTGLD